MRALGCFSGACIVPLSWLAAMSQAKDRRLATGVRFDMLSLSGMVGSGHE